METLSQIQIERLINETKKRGMGIDLNTPEKRATSARLNSMRDYLKDLLTIGVFRANGKTLPVRELNGLNFYMENKFGSDGLTFLSNLGVDDLRGSH